MMNRNYQKELEQLLERQETKGKRLFLHSCCAPCSSYVLEYLRSYFQITVFYYNPNITMEPEYRKRVEEQKRLIHAYNEQKQDGLFPIQYVDGDYEPDRFLQSVKGLESCPEGGERCRVCFALRLAKTAQLAAEGKYDYFATTLTISPMKDAHKLNEIGEHLADKTGVSWLPSDFKKKNGYKRSIELSAEYGLYRQDYCGCIFSQEESRQRRKEQDREEQDSHIEGEKHREDI